MTAKTLRFVAGLSESLYQPLSDGTTTIHRDVPITVTNEDDYNRLIRSGKYEEVIEEQPEPEVEKEIEVVKGEKQKGDK